MECKLAVLELLQGLLAQKGDRDPVPNDSPLFTTGRLQSIDGIQVAVFLEERFGVDFSTIGFDQEKIDTVNSICALIEESRPREHTHQ
jgi:acyl carrier protein